MSDTAKKLSQVRDVTPRVKEELLFYRDNQEFLNELDFVLRSDYKTELLPFELKEAGQNLTAMLSSFI